MGEQYAEEQNKRKAEWEQTMRAKKAEQIDIQPYVAETTLIEQTILFCKSLVADKGPVKEEVKKEINHDNPDTHMVLLSKDQRDEDYYFAPTAKKKAKSKNKGGGGDAGGKAKPIKHNAETFKLFDQLKLNAPITTEDVPALLEKLQEQLEHYKQKVKEWEINRDEKKKKILEGKHVDDDEEAEEKAE